MLDSPLTLAISSKKNKPLCDLVNELITDTPARRLFQKFDDIIRSIYDHDGLVSGYVTSFDLYMLKDGESLAMDYSIETSMRGLDVHNIDTYRILTFTTPKNQKRKLFAPKLKPLNLHALAQQLSDRCGEIGYRCTSNLTIYRNELETVKNWYNVSVGVIHKNIKDLIDTVRPKIDPDDFHRDIFNTLKEDIDDMQGINILPEMKYLPCIDRQIYSGEITAQPGAPQVWIIPPDGSPQAFTINAVDPKAAYNIESTLDRIQQERESEIEIE
jgi:hypothetical protein